MVRVERSRDVIVGRARDVDEYGQLIVEVDGEEVAISVGDVVHVRAHDGESS
jgi:biotin-(acetyl-CoA carboxylase) ligase